MADALEIAAAPAYPLAMVDAPALPIGNTWSVFPGILLCFAIAGLSKQAMSLIPVSSGAISPLTIALVLGVVLGNALPARVDSHAAGIAFAKKQLLRAAIVLYGFRLTLQDFGAAGWPVIAVDVLVLASTFALALWIGTQVLKLDFETCVLVGAGSSICGASAVLASGPMVRANAEQTCIAIATVAVFGTAAFVVYPLIHQLATSHFPSLGPAQFGVYIGSTVHDVAQVVATASASGALTQAPAVVAKMGRVALLAPFLVGLAFWVRRGEKQRGLDPIGSVGASMPWFPLLFAVAVLINSLAPVSVLRPALASVDTWALGVAMAALGLTTRIGAIRAAGPRPMVLAGVLFVWLIAGGALINAGVFLIR